eukprot:TRINITY_DN32637_c0_g1_i1.p1 TRINITY_DN32637_c0_g1~~TRINITY_DN32637_c0_g1_i1.p1  ORF type:complete len:267 (+),score=127.69 TRINITY_DN32637_c0_g1_i1:55-855(+)
MAEEEPASKRRKVLGAAKYSTGTAEGAPGVKWTRFPIRVRAHRNPLADNDDVHPVAPEDVEWDKMYPERNGKTVTVLDIGCAYAGLLCKLSALHPDTLMMGMEIREKVVDFSQQRILKLRDHTSEEGDKDHHYNNTWVVQANAMKFLPHHFEKGQLEHMFFCYADPHFKKKNFRRRIISPTLLHEYAYVLKDGGLLYTVTDVKELGEWNQGHLDASPLFERLSDEEVAANPFIDYVANASEDAVRTTKQNLSKYYSIHRKKPAPPL